MQSLNFSGISQAVDLIRETESWSQVDRDKALILWSERAIDLRAGFSDAVL